MTIETNFHNWQTHQPEEDVRYNRCSPNLVALGTELGKRWGMTNLGCYSERDIKAGTSPSSHSHGAATDRRYAEVGRAVAVSEIIPWLIGNSRELHIDAIHDYFGSRIWRAGRTSNVSDAYTAWWKPNTGPNMGESWAVYFHLETTETGWHDTRPIPDRLGVTVPIPTPIPTPGGPFVHATVKKGDVNADVFALQVILRLKASQTNLIADGQFGSATELAVKKFQTATGLLVDGVAGPKTWAKADALANS